MSLVALIESGAYLNVRNQDGETPWMTASSPKVAKVLVEAGADISVRNNDGYSALDMAKAFASNGDKLEAENNHDKIAVLETAVGAEAKNLIAGPGQPD